MAKKRIDITGEEYGFLKVIKEVEPHKYARRYLCRCDLCGEEFVTYMNNIRSGHVKSCGCLQSIATSKANLKDLTNKTFGRLRVKERCGSDKRGKPLWRCVCSCDKNKERTVPADRLLNGMTKSCGCLRTQVGEDLQEYNKENLMVDGVNINSLKRKARSDSQTGVKGVSITKRKNSLKYTVRIGVKGKTYYLGSFDTLEEAIEARKKGEEKYHKPYLEEMEEDNE